VNETTAVPKAVTQADAATDGNLNFRQDTDLCPVWTGDELDRAGFVAGYYDDQDGFVARWGDGSWLTVFAVDQPADKTPRPAL
jgi:hypothetical protein